MRISDATQAPMLTRLLITMLAVVAGSTMAVAGEGTISFDANESPPFWSETMPYNGMCGEIMQAAAEVTGVTFHIDFKPLKRMIEDDGNNDLGNPEFFMINQDFDAVVPLAIYHVALFSYRPKMKKMPLISSLADLKGYKVGILKGTLVDRAAFDRVGISFEESYSQASLFKKLQRGRIDLVLEIELVGRDVIKRLFPGSSDAFDIVPLSRSHSAITLLIANDYPDAEKLGEKFRAGMQQIKKSGRYMQILERYYGKDGVPDHYMKELQLYEYLYAPFEGREQ